MTSALPYKLLHVKTGPTWYKRADNINRLNTYGLVYGNMWKLSLFVDLQTSLTTYLESNYHGLTVSKSPTLINSEHHSPFHELELETKETHLVCLQTALTFFFL
jgi:hypothetical protein